MSTLSISLDSFTAPYFQAGGVEWGGLMKKIKIGLVCTRLTVISRRGSDKNGHSIWSCQCLCGNVKNVLGTNLLRGKTTSCGCFNKEQSRNRNTIHGMYYTRPNEIWAGMKKRITNKNSSNYKNYGGRGLTLASSWKTFQGFWRDMEKGYTQNLSIDRIDNDKGYSKENCRWATRKEQANNTSINHIITLDGQTKTLAQWADHTKIKESTIRWRINHGWNVHQALLTKLRSHIKSHF